MFHPISYGFFVHWGVALSIKKLSALIFFIVSVLALCINFYYPGYLLCSNDVANLQRVAHGAGGFKEMVYTDSIDALNNNVKAYELFEIDLATTSDGGIVCLHDWGRAAEQAWGLRFDERPTLSTLEKLISNSGVYRNCTLHSLADWLSKHPEKRIVTDVKDDNLYVLSKISETYPNLLKQVIPQIYHPSEFEPVKALGYKDVIFTIYRYDGDDSLTLRSLRNMDIFALTMPNDRARRLAPRARCLGVPTYAHTINDMNRFEELRKLGVGEIYTDWLSPE